MDALLLGRLVSPHFDNPTPTLAGFMRISPTHDGLTATSASSDQADLSGAATAPTQILSEEILRALEAALADSGVTLDRSATPEAFTPEKLAERILGFVESMLGDYAPDDPERAVRLEQAIAGIREGFDQAREVLDGLGVLQGELAANIERTRSLIGEGLERLAAGGAALPEAAPAVSGEAVARSLSQSASFSTRQTTSLVIDTVDGDRITIEIDKQASASRSHLTAADGATGVSALALSSEASVDFSYRVEGELDDDERAAVEDLVARIDRMSERFFAGNMQAAFNKAARLGFDSEELAGFSLEMSRTQNFQAVTAYRATMPIAEDAGSLADIADFGGDLRDLMADPPTRFAEPQKAVGRLFDHLVDERAATQMHALREDALATLRGLVDEIVAHYQREETPIVSESDDDSEVEHDA